jgi:hypothetical protein
LFIHFLLYEINELLESLMKFQEMKMNQKRSNQVPWQYLGYSLQPVRFLVRLIEGDSDSNVSLEAFEDIGVETSNGHRIAEQDKSAPRSNPVSDRATELWKTFSNWIHAVQSGQLDPGRTTFEIYVSHRRTGNIVESFSRANNPQDSYQALKEAKKIIWGPPPLFPLKSSVPATIEPYVTTVFEADVPLVSKIIQNFHLICGSGSPQADLHALVSKAWVPEEIVNDTLHFALGWVKRETDLLLEQGKVACLSVGVFRRNIISFVRRHDCRTILDTFAKAPTQTEIESQRLRTYVRQLEIIREEDEHKIRAIADYLRAEVDRTHWAEKGYVHELSFDEFEKNLQRTWINLKTKTDIALAGHNEVERGKYLCSECEMHHALLEGLDLPPHFTPGSFHALSDRTVIGWHPNYETLLKGD